MRAGRAVKLIGLTGGSGVGKSSVCDMLRGMGAAIVDCDKIAHEVILRGRPAYDELLAAFGASILGEDGEINRRALGAKAFGDERLRQTLVAITHKHIIERAVADIAAQKAMLETEAAPGPCAFVVLDAPLLVEANMHGFCDQVWAVAAPLEARVARIVKRDSVTEAAAAARIAAQMPPDELAAYADAVIDNGGSIKDLQNIVERLAEDV